ncbi:MAG: hypothetical protein J0H82_06420 [Alphaproteobacteria bacterium]|jgi:hypothetical protein|nr:hypothetical protein [Alphaproteobacteria bacterium]
MYLVTEPYDGTRVRVLVAARTAEAAEQKFQRVSARRAAAGYQFFSPIRHVIGSRRLIETLDGLDRLVAGLPTWEN